MTPTPSHDPIALLMIAGAVALYFLPGFVAERRKHPQRLAITVLNLLGGWTAVGWLVALVWACTVVRQAAPPAPRASAPPRSPGTTAPRPRPRFPVALEDELALHALRSRSLDER